MVKKLPPFRIILMLITTIPYVIPVYANQFGGISGTIYDKDFEAPLAAAQVLIAETGQKAVTTDGGNFVFSDLNPGNYTLVFSKDGYVRQVKANLVVSVGMMTELDIWLSGEFTEMEEFVVQDVQIGTGTEAALLDLRMESPSLMDSISSELMSKAGVSDAASALRLISGTTVQDGKYAVVRGLPDRYVNSQMNGVRLPTADADKRAVQLDQFPAAIIDSIQVSKTFTPDQQGDASGGAVNVILKGIPNERVLKLESGITWNTQVAGNNKFLTSKGRELSYFGKDKRDIPTGDIGENWKGSVGVSTSEEPTDYKWSVTFGDKYELTDDLRIGGLGSFFYERDSSYFKGGIDDKYWVETPGARMTPQYSQGAPSQEDFKTKLFDITQGSQEVKWGTLGVLGLETDNHSISLLYMYTRVAESVATLAQDIRGKAGLNKYWPDYYGPEYNNYDRNNPTHPGNQISDAAAPYLRTETLEYTERTTQTLQLSGRHKLPYFPEISFKNIFTLLAPEIDWSVSTNLAAMYQPDKVQFGSLWWGESYNPGFPPWVPPATEPAVHRPFKPAANFTLGNLQRIWKDISEESNQWRLNLKLPFEQWSGDKGYVKLGWFSDKVSREYNQESFSNFNDNSAQYEGPWEEFWSGKFPLENHPITAAEIDVDYKGKQKITAWYYMADLPVCSFLNIIGGFRHENTSLSIVNDPEKDATWVPPGSPGPVKIQPGDTDVSFKQKDVLPSLGFVFKPLDKIVFKGSYSQTVARQTFKELTPIQQQEYLGGDVFVGNPYLKMSALKNYDIRLDYTPYDGGLFSVSYFYKDVKDPIEYIQRVAGFDFTAPVNYPKGKLEGWEVEIRQDIGHFWKRLQGLTIGANATFINSEVTLPQDEIEELKQPNINAPMSKRDMTNTPEYLYNLFLTYDMAEAGLPNTEVTIFYTVKGDTLVAGAGQSNGKFVPSVYETEYGTLNLGVSHKLRKNWILKFQAKNLLDPKIESVYRSTYIGDDVTKTSYRKGMEFSLGLAATF